MGFVNDRSQRPYKTIDVERDIKLFCIEGIPYNLGFLFELHFGENVAQFSAYTKVEPVNKNAKVTYKIFQVSVPKNFPLNKVQLRQVVTDALIAFGYMYQTKDIQSVVIEVDPSLASI